MYVFVTNILFHVLFRKKVSRTLYVVVISFILYSFINIYNAILLAGIICINYIVIKRYGHKKLYVTLAVLCNILLLTAYKLYSHYCAVSPFHVSDCSKSILPLGMSYFIFSIISSLFDVYRKQIKKPSFIDYSAFVLFFPKLFVGPITRLSDMIDRQGTLKITSLKCNTLRESLLLILTGIFKIVVIASTLQGVVDYSFLNISLLSGPEALVISLAYSLVIYFDFSGAVDIVRGTSLLFGIHLPDNFNRPYVARTIQDFWRRWHITLSTFTRDYVYIPLGGNRVAFIRRIVNICIVFMLTGLWHGITLNFLLWGLSHGLAIGMYLLYEKYTKDLDSILVGVVRYFSPFITFMFVNFAWILFRSPDLSTAVLFYKKIIDFPAWSFDFSHIAMYYLYYVRMLIAAIAIVSAFLFILYETEFKKITNDKSYLFYVFIISLVSLFYLSFVTYTLTPNIYVGF